MKFYDFRINRPKSGDGYFKKLHLGQHSTDAYISPKAKRQPKIRWLRGIAPHIQQLIFRATTNRAKGEKRVGKISLSNTAVVSALENIGIGKRWMASSSLIELLHLDTSFIKGDYIQNATRLEFKLADKTCYYFDGGNRNRNTGTAHFLCFRLLKETPRLFHTK
jgi:hypothetical protein